ncbi:MAG TPA: TAXI family TRAP transporter solute-binding subunit [Usitatibacter sp.]|nr:TAXI family TRAP transporter solute-binding subunit [Usitatibacter sp.]
MKTIHGWMAGIAAALVAGAALAQGSISIGTGGTGGVYYPLGGGMASIISKKVPGVQASAEVTGGSIDNMKLMHTGKAEMGIVQSDAAYDATMGQDKFKDMKVPVRALMVLYPSRMHLVTTEASGIKRVADLKGKRISSGSAGSGTEVMTFRILEAAGLDRERDVKRERLGVSESVNALKDGKIDAFFFAGGIPTAAITDLAATPGMKMRLVDHAELADAMRKKFGPFYTRDTIPAKSYSGQETANQMTSAWNLLVAHERMPEKMAYDIVKTLWESQPELVTVHKEAMNIDMANQNSTTSPIPFHPGAVRFYKEKGIALK